MPSLTASNAPKGPLVHTDDLTDLYELILHAALSGEDCGSGRSGYYNAANGQ